MVFEWFSLLLTFSHFIMITKLGLQGKSPTIFFYRLLKWDRHWEDPEGSGGGGGGAGIVYPCISMADSCQCMTKATAILWSG